jgi:hypothetical protein
MERPPGSCGLRARRRVLASHSTHVGRRSFHRPRRRGVTLHRTQSFSCSESQHFRTLCARARLPSSSGFIEESLAFSVQSVFQSSPFPTPRRDICDVELRGIQSKKSQVAIALSGSANGDQRWSYQDVRENAGRILERLEDETMPCDAPWETFERGLPGAASLDD